MKAGKSSCGLRYAVSKSGSAVAYCALSIRCGTRDEGRFQSGIAHFVEHTLFKGTTKKNAATINSYLDSLGGELNAYTTKEEIVLHATVLKEDLPKAAGLLFEIVSSATFPAKEIETEKGVVIDEIQSYKDSPSEDIYDRFEEMLFTGSELSRPILGTAASVKKISRESLLEFTKENFTPDRMAFTVVAPLEEDKMVKMVDKMVNKYYPDAPEKEPYAVNLEPYTRPEAPFDKTIQKRNHEVNCIVGTTAPSLYDGRKRIATILLCNILGGPASNSRLNAILREKNGWVYGVECTFTQYADTGIVAISLGCDKENLDKCLVTLDKEIARLIEKPLGKARLAAASRQLLGQLAISSDNAESQCLSMGKALLSYGKIDTAEHNRSLIESITPEEIQQTAKELLSPDRLSKLIYL